MGYNCASKISNTITIYGKLYMLFIAICTPISDLYCWLIPNSLAHKIAITHTHYLVVCSQWIGLERVYLPRPNCT